MSCLQEKLSWRHTNVFIGYAIFTGRLHHGGFWYYYTYSF